MRVVLVGLLVVVAACAPEYRYTATTQNAGAPKPASCSFELLTTRPARPYVELGVLERYGKQAKTAAVFGEVVRGDVCRVGGDAVLTEINGFGVYVRGTVLRYQ